MTDPTPETRLVLPRVRWGWVLVVAAVLVFLFGARAALGPFLAGFVIAYLLDPVTDKVERAGVPRWLATFGVLGTFVAAIVLLVLLIAPIVVQQFGQLIDNLPRIVEAIRPDLEAWSRRLGGPAQAADLGPQVAQRAIAWLATSIGGIIAGGLAFFNIVALAVVAPVVAFYLLRDWNAVTARIDSWWPRRHAPTIRLLLAEADRALSGFVRGQSLVCLCMAALYALGWGLIGLDYAFVLALLAGLLGFVPFVGPVIGLGLAVLVSIGEFGIDFHVGLVIGVFVAVQTIEGSVLTPNLIGNRIGLHPVWVLFAIFAGGELMGFVGILLAVPIAAVVGVLGRWLIGQYLMSGVYADGPPAPVAPLPPARTSIAAAPDP